MARRCLWVQGGPQHGLPFPFQQTTLGQGRADPRHTFREAMAVRGIWEGESGTAGHQCMLLLLLLLHRVRGFSAR